MNRDNGLVQKVANGPPMTIFVNEQRAWSKLMLRNVENYYAFPLENEKC
jgi:hypothetical protein